MKPYKIDVPCSPGDQVYLLCNDGIRMLPVKKIETYKDFDRDEIVTNICFSNHPHIIVTDETRKRIYGNYKDAIKALKEFNNE